MRVFNPKKPKPKSVHLMHCYGPMRCTCKTGNCMSGHCTCRCYPVCTCGYCYDLNVMLDADYKDNRGQPLAVRRKSRRHLYYKLFEMQTFGLAGKAIKLGNWEVGVGKKLDEEPKQEGKPEQEAKAEAEPMDVENDADSPVPTYNGDSEMGAEAALLKAFQHLPFATERF